MVTVRHALAELGDKRSALSFLKVKPAPNCCVISGLPDNEGADLIFCKQDWRELEIWELASHPSSVWFLSEAGLDYFLPAITIAALYLLEAGYSEEGRDLIDHLESKLDRLALDEASGVVGENSMAAFNFAKSIFDEKEDMS